MELLTSTVALWIVWPALVGILSYWYVTRNNDYWKKRGVPFAPPFPVVGNLASFLRKPMHLAEDDRYQKYGRLYGQFEGTRPTLIIADPELLKQILVKDFPSFTSRRDFRIGEPINDNMVQNMQGEEWKRVRSIITPTFTTGKIRRMLGIFEDCAKTLSQNFLKASKADEPINAKRLFGAFTMDVIASSAFSTKLDSHNDPNNEFIQMARKVFGPKIPWRFTLLMLFPTLSRLFGVSLFQPEATNFFKEVVIQIIEERKRSGQTRNDFLQLLMDTAKKVSEEEEEKEDATLDQEDITSNYGTEENSDIFKQYYKKKQMTNDELVAQCVIFFLAGYETTAATMAFTSYCLALNPDAQEKLIEEIDREVTSAGGKLTYEAIQRMKYLDNVISETLRIFPPAIRTERVADEDYKLGDTGITIPKNMLIGIPIYSMHRDPEFFPEPEKFDPERFSPEGKASWDPYNYMPFGAGPRNCIGMRFALMETKVGLAYTLSNYRVRRCPETKVPLEFTHGLGLLQAKAIMLKMETRKDRVSRNQ